MGEPEPRRITTPAGSGPSETDRTLREVVERLALIERPACSPGERKAAEWIAERLRVAGAVDVELEEEPSWGLFPPTLTGLGALGTAGAGLVLAGRRALGTAIALLAAAGLLDEVQNGPRVLRRALRRRRTTVNVVARAGDLSAERTLVVLGHHDAPQTGLIFNQGPQRAVHRVAPGFLARFKTPAPQWWLGLSGLLMTAAGALTGRRRPARAGITVGALGTAIMADIWRSPTVPGANDNLSGVAALVALAERLRRDPVPGLAVVLVSCGAEETMQDGIRGFLDRHGDRLPLGRTWFLNFETVGSPHLVLVEAEGPVWMEEYADPSLRHLVARCAAREGIALSRGWRARASSDSIIPSRAGYPTAMLSSLTDWRAPANYHLLTDVPENLTYETIGNAVRVGHALARELAAPDLKPGAKAG